MAGQMSAGDIQTQCPNSFIGIFITQMKVFPVWLRLKSPRCCSVYFLGMGDYQPGNGFPYREKGKVEDNCSLCQVHQAVLPQVQEDLRKQELETTTVSQAS